MKYNYPLSAFTSLSDDSVRHRILRAAILAAIPEHALLPGRSGARFIDDNRKPDPRFQFDFGGATLNGAQEAALDAIVAAHAGPGPRPAPLLGSVLHHPHQWDPNTQALRYIPWRGTNPSTSPGAGSARHFFHGPVRLIEILVWTVGSTSLGITAFTLHRNNSSEASAEVSRNCPNVDTPYIFNFRDRANTTVPFGEAIAIGCDAQRDPGGDIVASTVWMRVPPPT